MKRAPWNSLAQHSSIISRHGVLSKPCTCPLLPNSARQTVHALMPCQQIKIAKILNRFNCGFRHLFPLAFAEVAASPGYSTRNVVYGWQKLVMHWLPYVDSFVSLLVSSTIRRLMCLEQGKSQIPVPTLSSHSSRQRRECLRIVIVQLGKLLRFSIQMGTGGAGSSS